MTIGGQVKLTDAGATGCTGLFKPASTFSIDLYNNGDSPVLNLQNAQALFTQTGNLGNKFDFYNVVQAGGSGTSTVNYTGNTDQEVYNYVSGSTVDNYVENDVATGDGVVYQNLGFSGSGTKTVDAPSSFGTLLVANNVTLSTGADTVDLNTNNCALVIGANLTTGTGSVLNCGTRPVVIGASFNNSGTCNFGSAQVTFNSGSSETLSTVSPVLFKNITFQNGSFAAVAGNFSVASDGVLTLSSSAQLNVFGNFTLNSDVNGSATVAAIPSGCSIIGDVNVQRYVTNHRAYRLASSPVYAATVGANNVYGLDYIKKSIYVTGTTGIGGGFDKGGNPTLYLYRENLVPYNGSFTGGNFRGVNNLTASPYYQLDVDTGSYNIPAGNGFLFFYRGSRRQGSLVGQTTPGAAATIDTLTAIGTLNQGTVTVSDWYTPGSANLGWTTISGDPAIEGFNLAGNPYASSIDWDKCDSTNVSAAIYAPHVAPFSYQLIPTGALGSGNYGVYQAGSGGFGTNGATNVIASGTGFFVQATSPSAQLVFTENAKTNTQAVAGVSLFMGKPVATTNNDQFLRLQFAKDSINSDESIIRFDSRARTAFDLTQDARYKSGSGLVSLSSLSADNVALAINRVALPKMNRPLKIRLKIGASAGGVYQMNLKAVNQVPKRYDILLADAYTKDSIDMRKNPSYSFSILRSDTNSFGSGRFALIIREDPADACKLVSFDAQRTGAKPDVQVVWKTVNEQNYTHFTVERSTDNGKTFNTLGGFVSNDQGTYSLLDKNPSYGDNYYRLKQEDIDDVISYSKTVQIDIVNRGDHVVSVYPNPAKNVINLSITTRFIEPQTFNIRVSNSSGIIVRDVLSSQPNWQTNVSNLLTGTYLIQVIDNKDKSLVGQAKFVKM